MFVCICNAVCDRRVKDAITAGNKTSDEVYSACGVQPQCGCCRDEIDEMIADHVEASAQFTALAAE